MIIRMKAGDVVREWTWDELQDAKQVVEADGVTIELWAVMPKPDLFPGPQEGDDG
jgi:hypothetical protein